jgi:thioesterase domain-containing protein/acyl carrier protein
VVTRTSSTIEMLGPIWRRLLQQSHIAPEDNFFDLGGDSALAVQLFSEIARACGRQLPPMMIYHVPTMAGQAAILASDSDPEISPLVTLKTGDDQSPVFIAPGLGGGPAEFFELVKYIRLPHAIYGLQPKGLEGFDAPSNTIEDMAAHYLRGITRLQARGPYRLIGYSLGGLVALEMALDLKKMGHDIALLVMIDSYPHINFLPAGRRLGLMAQRAKVRGSNVFQKPLYEPRLGGLNNVDEISTFAPAFAKVREGAYSALQSYEPRFYPGKINFVRAQMVTEFPEDPSAVWSDLTTELKVETVPGNHLTMLTTHCETLASVLSRYLKDSASA